MTARSQHAPPGGIMSSLTRRELGFYRCRQPSGGARGRPRHGRRDLSVARSNQVVAAESDRCAKCGTGRRPVQGRLYVQMVKWLAATISAIRISIRMIVLSPCSKAPGGSAPAPNSTPARPCRCLRHVRHAFGSMCISTAPRKRMPFCSLSERDRERRRLPRSSNAAQAADLAVALLPRAAGRSAVARLIRSSTRSIEATSIRLRPLSLAR